MGQQMLLGLVEAKIPLLPVKERIKQGNWFLCLNYGPEWRDIIDVETLDMEDPKSCILGQIFDHFLIGRSEFHISQFEAVRLAFDIMNSDSPTADKEYNALTNGWKRFLRRKRSRVLV